MPTPSATRVPATNMISGMVKALSVSAIWLQGRMTRRHNRRGKSGVELLAAEINTSVKNHWERIQDEKRGTEVLGNPLLRLENHLHVSSIVVKILQDAQRVMVCQVIFLHAS
jgi:hypothetical protein